MFRRTDYAYFVIVAVELYAEITSNQTLRMISKPLLMPALVVLYATGITGAVTAFHRLLIAAFVFSWVGDVALMFVHVNETFFLLGLVGFLITHILYTVAFAKVNHKEVPAILPRKFWIITPLFIYMAALLYMLVPGITAKPETKPFLVPVLVYSTAIGAMVLFSINRYKRVNDISFALVFIGALLFMFSDSLIAIGKFLQPTGTVESKDAAGFFIMLLYTAGQYFIARGCLKQVNQPV